MKLPVSAELIGEIYPTGHENHFAGMEYRIISEFLAEGIYHAFIIKKRS